MSDLEQKGGDEAEMYQAGGDMHVDKSTNTYLNDTEAEQKDMGIISEIFIFIIKNLSEQSPINDKKYISVTEKIALNFKNTDEQERVAKYFTLAYTKTGLIQKQIELEDTEIQNDITGDIFEKYNKLKDKGVENIKILEQLFDLYSIPDKKNNPAYANLTRAFVLFFFDDCTIFEKTESEKKT